MFVIELLMVWTQSELETQLKLALKNNSPFSNETNTIRLSLRSFYLNALLYDLQNSIENDLEASLWKLVHYRTIEEFRKRVKVIHQAAKAKNQNKLANAEKHNLRQLSAEFQFFLKDATTFYLQFILHLTKLYSLDPVEKFVLKNLEFLNLQITNIPELPPSTIISPELQSAAVQICHRSLIFLGDLQRYVEMHSERKPKNWNVARTFYSLALLLVPENGNPFNQFAVIDTYEGDELGAVERYFRRH
ncbi:hypothetical protein HK098_007748 [Nowakowskiella sp. JEL0407]|nr:hypothetical protein HK098_007748 [Nowakowskiella sp. JEL0407]